MLVRLWLLCLLCFAAAQTHKVKEQTKLNKVIDEALALGDFIPKAEAAAAAAPGLKPTKPLLPPTPGISSVGSSCSAMADKEDDRRSQCCLTKDAKVMHHVMVGTGGITVFAGKDGKDPKWDQTSAEQHFGKLDPVKSLISRKWHNVNAPKVSVVNEEFSPTASACKSYFNGTLHVMGQQTVKVTYHAMADNYVPIVSQILTDAYTGSYSILLLSYSISSGALGSPDLLLLCSMISLALHNTYRQTYNNPFD